MTLSCHLSSITSLTLSLPGMLRWWTRWTWMPARAYRGVPFTYDFSSCFFPKFQVMHFQKSDIIGRQ